MPEKNIHFPALALTLIRLSTLGARKKLRFPSIVFPFTTIKKTRITNFLIAPAVYSSKFVKTAIAIDIYAPALPKLFPYKLHYIYALSKILYVDTYDKLPLQARLPVVIRSYIPKKLVATCKILKTRISNILMSKTEILSVSVCRPDTSQSVDYGLTPKLFADHFTKAELDLLGLRLKELHEKGITFEIWGWRVIRTEKGYFFMKIY